MFPHDRPARRALKPQLMPLEGRRLLTVTQSSFALAFAHQNMLRPAAMNPIAAAVPGGLSGLIGGTPTTGVAASAAGKLASPAANLKAVAALDAQSAAIGRALPVSPMAPTSAALALAKRGIRVPSAAPATTTGAGNLLPGTSTGVTAQAKAASPSGALTTQATSFAGSATSASFQSHALTGRPANVAAEQAASTPAALNPANRLS